MESVSKNMPLRILMKSTRGDVIASKECCNKILLIPPRPKRTYGISLSLFLKAEEEVKKAEPPAGV